MSKTYVNGQWLYGDAWERFPISDGQIWSAGPHRVGVFDLCKDDASALFTGIDPEAALTFSDPPWTEGQSASFYTKAQKEGPDFDALIRTIVANIARLTPRVAYLEMGRQRLEFLKLVIREAGGMVTNEWNITYYHKHPCKLIRLSFTSDAPAAIDLTGVDDEKAPGLIMAHEKPRQVIDFCTGRGLTGRTAHEHGAHFTGSELNKRRLANLLSWFNDKSNTPRRIL